MVKERRATICGAVLLAMAFASLARGQVPSWTETGGCFAIEVRLNGQPIAGPQAITLYIAKNETSVVRVGKCFPVPAEVVAAKKVYVSFSLERDFIQFGEVPGWFFGRPWDLDLADRRFGKDVRLPKGARVKQTCVLVVHAGEPERVVTTYPCRWPRAGPWPEGR